MVNITYGGKIWRMKKILTENSTLNSGINSGCTIQSKRAAVSIAESSDIVLKEGERCFVYEGTKPYNVNIRMGDGTTALKDLKNVAPEKATSSSDGLMSSSGVKPFSKSKDLSAVNILLFIVRLSFFRLMKNSPYPTTDSSSVLGSYNENAYVRTLSNPNPK